MFAQQISHHPHQGAAAATHLSQSSPSDCFMKTKEGGAKFNPLADKEEQPEESGGQFINRLYENNKKRGCAATKMSTSIDNMALQNSIEEEQKDSVVTTSITKSAAGVGGPEVDGDDVITIVPNEENRAEIRVTLKKPSLTMIQQHSLDSAPLKLQQEIEEKMTTANKLGGTAIRRSSTTPWGNGRKMTLGYKYARRPTEASVSFPIPPVFPKTCSLFDSTFNGGAFADSSEDKKLMDALVKVRRKMSGVQQPGQQTILEGHLMMNNSHTEDLTNMSDSGHSSITEGTSASPPLSGNISFFGHHHSSKDSVFFNNSTDNEHDNKSNEDGSNAQRRLKKRKSDFGLRKNSRIFFFRQRAKTNSEKRKNSAKSAPAINGQDANENGNNELPARPWTIDGSKGLSWKRKLLRTLSSAGGIHLGANHQEKGEKPSDHHFGKLDREWEVVTVRELCRRLSLEDSLEPSELPLPEGALQSQVLDEFMIRQIVDILPPRAEGYPWVNIYNSEKHGFSLATLYRKMSEWNEEMSPVLLVIRDVQGHVFGAVTSTALRPSDHYYGTGDSCLLYRFTGEYPHTRELRTYNWTGDNQFFVNATREFLSVGAGGGHYGLWLDADLNNGRTQKCATFDNEPLAGGSDEDFIIQFVEAFGFSMT